LFCLPNWVELPKDEYSSLSNFSGNTAWKHCYTKNSIS
jgi:hypothetical protein